MNTIQLELAWTHLLSIVNEQAKLMQRTAFSPVVREAGDLAYGIFDSDARMIAQADTGTPGHINCMAGAGKYLAERFAGRLKPGDVLINNDPWQGAGHVFDITIFAPIFWREKLIGYVGSTNHHTDIGGLGPGSGANDVHEEGLWIPPLKLYDSGRPNETLFDMISANVRIPDVVLGDLAAQVAAARGGGEAVAEMCERFGLEDISDLADQIISRSEKAVRDSIRACRAGTYRGEVAYDVPNGDIVKLVVTAKVDSQQGEILLDFAGSSPESRKGINVVLNYTRAYATFAVRSILSPEVPNNHGSIAPITVVAPEGSIVNCKYPAPVAARHIVGMYVPMPIMKAFHQFVPDRVVAPGTGASFSIKINGVDRTGRRFTSSISGLTGGMGARAEKPGLDATYYPAGVAAIPMEIIEAETPIVFKKRHIRRGSGGGGRSRGGDGQVVELKVNTDKPWTLNTSPKSRKLPPDGLAGGDPGKPASFQINGEERKVEGKMLMDPSDIILVKTPGGGGYGPAVTGGNRTERPNAPKNKTKARSI